MWRDIFSMVEKAHLRSDRLFRDENKPLHRKGL
jgi:hypothetical protein